MSLDKSMWKKYKEEQDQAAREELIMKHLNLVRYAAGRIMILLPEYIDKEDLESYGIIGLIQAVENFDYQRGVSFSTFALPRIKGEIYDFLRSRDWLPTNMRRQLKELESQRESFKAKNGREPIPEELSELTGIREDRIKTIEQHKQMSDWLSLSQEYDGVELIDLLASDLKSAVDHLAHQEAVSVLAEKIDSLSEQEKLVISLYYYEELTQVEIAEIMNLSSARISQIHARAVRRLRAMLSRSKEYFSG
ncbi:MAG: FliA/WhiG family RNA polymerase sigma factor [Halanaerobiales bacterium]|nr:FliA/WhiG family RNA polymerase sigma factor [Halanaerobiales bacterium]